MVGQKVPMLENIQYQNQMIRPVPPHAATYRRISQIQSTSESPHRWVAINLASIVSRVPRSSVLVRTPYTPSRKNVAL